MTALPPKRIASKPDFVDTHFPVSMGEFHDLKEAAAKLEGVEEQEEGSTSPEDAVQEDASSDEVDEEAEELDRDADVGEDDADTTAEPSALAPPAGHSFEGLPQTRFQRPDYGLTMGSNHVVTAVNTSTGIYTKGGTLQARWPDLTQFFGPVLSRGPVAA